MFQFGSHSVYSVYSVCAVYAVYAVYSVYSWSIPQGGAVVMDGEDGMGFLVGKLGELGDHRVNQRQRGRSTPCQERDTAL